MTPVSTTSDSFAVGPALGGVGAPAGFTAAAVHAGVKKTGALDLAVIAAGAAVPAAAIFTTNLAQAAPVLVSKEHLPQGSGLIRAIVVNAGCANACTGDRGMADARQMVADVATMLGCGPREVLVASTGVIGVNLPIASVSHGIRSAVTALGRDQGGHVARAIMTTDPFPKEHAVSIHTPGGTFIVGGMAKGSGMIEPNMATMLGFLTTDAQVPPALLHRALTEAAEDTFNAITVDGECSTNDSLFVMASGASGVVIDDDSYPALLEGLLTVSRELALGIVRGGEGATKLIAVTVRDARSKAEARQVARTIANSPLVKTAVHGADPNWGRIVCAAGRAGVSFDIGKSTVHVGGIVLFEDGVPHDEAAPEAEEYLKGDTIEIQVLLGTGGGRQATVYGCDLSAEYVRINGEYRT